MKAVRQEFGGGGVSLETFQTAASALIITQHNRFIAGSD